MELGAAISRVVDGGDLAESEIAAILGRVMDDQTATPAQIAALLVALRMKGETVGEVVGAARAMRARMRVLPSPGGVVVDTCGTGGDGRGTVNVSTLAAFVVAAAGVRVAKHGNRAQSSRSGSADLLEALGLPLSPTVEQHQQTLADVGLAFLFAPDFHPATRRVAGVRKELGVRTLFNLLGPLTNPAGAGHHVAGVYHPSRLTLVAEALGILGSERAWVVHGHGGLDEIAPDGPTEIAEWDGARVRRFTVTPSDFGLVPADPSGLAGGVPSENAAQAREFLDGKSTPAARASVLMTAGAALHLAGRGDLTTATATAATALDDGSAARILAALRKALA
jgi:anthranilate phosphoribosyltransferase